ncbi:MAG: DNA-binding response regulator, partial [Arcobacter sp.]
MYKILLLEDDELFASTVEDFLDEEGFEVDIASDGQECLDLNYNKNYDLYIFDINVPKINGLELLEQLRASSDETPTIFLTSYKDKETLSEAFLKGCDDYLKKPVEKALLKRTKKSFEDIYLAQNFVFQVQSKRLFKDGVDLNLPVKVLELVELFLQNKSQIVTKEMIIHKLWSCGQDYSEGSIRVYINHIKKIFGKDSVENIKGIGY